MIKWLFQTAALLLIAVGLIYGFVYLPDTLEYREYSYEYTTLDDEPLIHPCDASEMPLIFLVWVRDGCGYCARQLESLNQFIVDEGIADRAEIIIVKGQVGTVENYRDYTIIKGPEKLGVPFVEFWGVMAEGGGRMKIVEWMGLRDIYGIKQLVYDALEEMNMEDE